MARNEVEIRVTADTRDAEQNIKGIAREGRQLNVNLKQLAIGAGVTAAAIGGVAFAAKSLVSAYQEQARAERTLAQVVANTGVAFSSVREDILETTAALQRKTNFGDQEQIRVLTRMTTILGSVEDAQAALPAVLDAASVSGRDAATVAETLSKALAGQANIAESVGIKFDENADFQERLAIVMEKVGGAAEANADPFTQLGNSVGDLKEALGEILVGPAVELTKWLTNVAEQSGIALKAVQDFFSGADELAAMTSNIALGAGPDPEDQAQALVVEFEKLNSELQVFRQRAEEARKAGDFKEFNFASLRAQTLGEQVDALSNKLKEIRDTQKAQEEATISNTFAIDENVKHARLLAEAEAQAENRAKALTRAIAEYTDEAMRGQEETKNLTDDMDKVAKAMFDAFSALNVNIDLTQTQFNQLTDQQKAFLAQQNKLRTDTIMFGKAEQQAALRARMLSGELKILAMDLEEQEMWVGLVNQIMQDAEDQTISWAEAERLLKDLLPGATEVINAQTKAAQEAAAAFKAMEASIKAAAEAQAQFAGRGPSMLPVTRGFVEPVASNIFSGMSLAQQTQLFQEQGLNKGVPDLGIFIDFFRSMVEGFLSTSIDRTDALLRAQRQIEGFDSGGIVSGPRGAPRLVVAHGGETILPTHRGGSGMGITINNDFAGATIIGIDDLEETIAASVQAALTQQTAGRSRR